MGDEIEIIVRVMRVKEREGMKGDMVAGRRREAKGRRKGGKEGKKSRREKMQKTTPSSHTQSCAVSARTLNLLTSGALPLRTLSPFCTLQAPTDILSLRPTRPLLSAERSASFPVCFIPVIASLASWPILGSHKCLLNE